ncbi:MAG: hypothetical protein HOP19_28580 [Acidobacteria bacterium]|nr:hypothetical protein [Acidobacteriota bacterium]
MKAKQSNGTTQTTTKRAAPDTKNGTTVRMENGATPYVKSNANGHARNGATLKPASAATKEKKIPPPVVGKMATEVRLKFKPKPLSPKKLARLEKLKAYFDSLDEDTEIKEFEKLSGFEMHWLLCTRLAEEKNKKEQPVIVTTEIDRDLYEQLEEDAQTYGVANIGQYVYGLVKATYAKREEAMRIFAEAADLSRAS